MYFHPLCVETPREPPSWRERREEEERRRERRVGVGRVMLEGGRGVGAQPQFLFLLSPPKYFYLQSDCSLFI